ncbi:TRM11 family SAM-dependent methyltransferase [Patescibacteria group bacterium]
MPHYCFIPGSHPELSLAELHSVVSGTFKDGGNYFLIDPLEELRAPELQFRLGGTVKIAVIDQSIQFSELPSIFDINNLLGKYFAQSEDKITFGASIYGKKDNQLIKQIRRLGMQAKKELHANAFTARFVINDTGILSSVVVTKNHLIERGAEIIILNDGKKLHIGKTLTVQDFEEYSNRDYGRPARDTKRGILPPKVAQIMINLAEQKKDSVIIDPFCGTGTILQEALRAGYQNLTGSDISDKAIKDTQRNLDWYAKQKEIKNTVKLFQKDIRALSDEINQESVDGIITEPYLGPPLLRKPGSEKLHRIMAELELLYNETFIVFERILKSQGKAVISLPFFKLEESEQHINIEKCLNGTSLQIVVLGENKSLHYFRTDQIVGREIFILQKNADPALRDQRR